MASLAAPFTVTADVSTTKAQVHALEIGKSGNPGLTLLIGMARALGFPFTALVRGNMSARCA